MPYFFDHDIQEDHFNSLSERKDDKILDISSIQKESTFRHNVLEQADSQFVDHKNDDVKDL